MTTLPMKTALFVDFDNIYINLQHENPAAARQFATNPVRWLRWIEDGMLGAGESKESTTRRSVLVRRCYLNPGSFAKYRADFTRSGFTVVDCPTLTGLGKNSADIQMVLDVVDALDHPTRFDEFVILSGDADFTPVLTRLRAHDRRTAIAAIGPAAVAYRAASDFVIEGPVFLQDALQVSPNPPTVHDSSKAVEPLGPDSSYDDLLEEMATRLALETAARSTLSGSDVKDMLLDFPEFRSQKDWLGFFSLRNLTQELVRRNPELRVAGTVNWSVVHATDAAACDQTLEPTSCGLRRQIVDRVREMVAQSSVALEMARVANTLKEEFGQEIAETRWDGAGTFKALLLRQPDLGFELWTGPGCPGYVLDESRHTIPRSGFMADDTLYQHEVAELAREVSLATGTPRLTPGQYAAIFRRLEDDLARCSFNLTATSKAVRDAVVITQPGVSRSAVSFILQGIRARGYEFDEQERNTAWNLATLFLENVRFLCDKVGLDVGPDGPLERWVLGRLSPDQAPSHAAA
jgi:hypothetical protein